MLVERMEQERLCTNAAVLTLLIHLGYLAYDEEKQTVGIPNVEIRQEFIRAIKNRNRIEKTAQII